MMARHGSGLNTMLGPNENWNGLSVNLRNDLNKLFY